MTDNLEQIEFKKNQGKSILGSFLGLFSNLLVAGLLWYFQDSIFGESTFWRNFFVGLFIFAATFTFIGTIMTVFALNKFNSFFIKKAGEE